MIDIIIGNATVITVDNERRVLSDAAVAIDGGQIIAVGPTEEVEAMYDTRARIDAKNRVVIPGFVDLYAHGGCGLLKSVAEQYAGVGWWRVMDALLHGYVSERWWYLDAQLHAAERLRFGCTAILSQPGLSHARLDTLAPIQAAARGIDDLGLRAGVIAGMPRSMPWNDRYADVAGSERIEKSITPEIVLSNIDELFEESDGRVSDRVSYWLGSFVIGRPTLSSPDLPQSPFEPDRPLSYFLAEASRLLAIAERHGARYWAHAWADSVTHAFDDGFRDLLGSRTVLSHCTRLDDRSIDILSETQTHVNHCPRARRLQMWHESCRVVEMLDAGVNVGLGSDGPQVDRNSDPFMDMQMAFKLQRRRFSDAGVLPVGTLLEMSTLNGYKALGLADVAGSIEVGKKADIAIVNMRQFHLWPLTMPVHQLVYYANGNDIEHVFVDGEHLVEHGKVKSVDESALLDEAAEEMEKLFAIGGPRAKRWFTDEDDIWSTSRRSQVADPFGESPVSD